MSGANSSRGLVTLLAFCGFVTLAGASLDEPGPEKGDTAPPVDPVVQARPADEAALMTHDQDSAEMRAAPNDIIRTQVEARLDKAFCAAVNKVKEFSNWTGRVQRINFNGYFEIDLGGYITLHDIDITPSTELFKVIAALREGQPIKVSGYFKHGAEACSIFVNREFSVHLTKITPL